MWTRRDFLVRSAGLGASAFLFPGCARRPQVPDGILLNDVCTRLNETRVAAIERPDSVEALAGVVRAARDRGAPVSIAGGRHASGGQQFGKDTLHVDTTALSRVIGLDAGTGVVEAEAGITWVALHAWLRARDGHNEGGRPGWGIRQKQCDTDDVCLGGTLAANAHGRSLHRPPVGDDVEAVTLVDAEGNLIRCSRTEHAELFARVIGGYGLFGVIATVHLRLSPRAKVVRRVELIDARDAEERLARCADDGFVLGDCELATDLGGAGGLRRAILSCSRPVDGDTPLTPDWKRPTASDRLQLARLVHGDPSAAFGARAAYALATDGLVTWSDEDQLGTGLHDLHAPKPERIRPDAGGSDVITEVFLPRGSLPAFLEKVREDFRRSRPRLIRGTVRTVAAESETLLAWAREPWTCVSLHLHIPPHSGAIGRAADDVRRVLDHALEASGSFSLAHHRWATKEQVLAAHPGLPAFLKAKRNADPHDVFQSDWYRHYRTTFAEEIA